MSAFATITGTARRVLLACALPLIALGSAGCERSASFAAIDQGPDAGRSLVPSRHYTRHAVGPRPPEIMPIRIHGDFSLYERAQVLQAVNEWNYALNGTARFEIVEDAAAAYAIVSSPVRVPLGSSRFLLALAPPALTGPRTVTVFMNRLGNRDLRALMLHELGHLLDLPHAERGVMSPDYNLLEWRCVDKATASTLARMRGLALTEFNWCDT